MRIGVGPRRVAAEAVDLVAAGGAALRRFSPSRLPVHGLALAMAAFLLAGCEAAPWPDGALLKPQPPPKCVAKADAGAAAPDAAGDQATKLRKLDYEAQCYRHAEMIARARLGRLQAQVQDRVRAAKASKEAPGTPP